uniref:DoxX family protein n=1 Tax=uncultured Muribaculaceae bacterium TaxID=2301481 RepID=A0A6G8F3E2_9BACT|nr:hypothetical protein Muribac1_0190 [uncultured Muribaculaceae bacterium]
MNDILREIVFPASQLGLEGGDWLLLAFRLLFGGLLLVHGIQKVAGYHNLTTSFPDPIGLGSKRSLQLAILAEFLCSMAVMAGFMFRLALIPPVVTMFVAGFFALRGQPWLQRELPISYMSVFILLMITGPGRISIDAIL